MRKEKEKKNTLDFFPLDPSLFRSNQLYWQWMGSDSSQTFRKQSDCDCVPGGKSIRPILSLEFTQEGKYLEVNI